MSGAGECRDLPWDYDLGYELYIITSYLNLIYIYHFNTPVFLNKKKIVPYISHS